MLSRVNKHHPPVSAWLISLLLHAVVFLAAIAYFYYAPVNAEIGMPEAPVTSYVALSTPVPEAPVVSKAKAAAAPVADSEEEEADEPLAATPSVNRSEQAAASASAPAASRVKADQADALLTLLHNAILSHQQYPDSALALGREGRVTVAFVLQPDGQIQALHLVTSSGTASLDEAALMAVQQATPFEGIGAYVPVAKAFQLDVVFHLPH